MQMTRFIGLGQILAFASLPLAAVAQAPALHDIPLRNWPAPLYWQPTKAEMHDSLIERNGTLVPLVSLPTPTLVFVGITPCRVVDTRVASFGSSFGPPSLVGGVTRTFPIRTTTNCAIPFAAVAYSFNVTVTPVVTPGVNPPGYLGYLTLWPTGAPQPNASTLNNYLGTVVFNAAVVAAGDNGSIDALAEEATNLILDINGYYVASGSGSQWTNSGLNIYYDFGNVGIGTTTPIRRLDVAGVGRFTGGIMFGDGTTQTTAAGSSLLVAVPSQTEMITLQKQQIRALEERVSRLEALMKKEVESGPQ